jgi:hypothetical protein
MSNILINSTLGLVDTTLPGQITDLQAIEATNNSINLTWTAPADNGTDVGSGAVIQYDIRYSSSNINSSNWLLAPNIIQAITPKTPGSQEKFTVTSLESETTYYFAIKARDERPNWALVSNSPFNTTLPDPDLTAPAAVVDLTANTVNQTIINLTWTSTGDDGNLGIASIYDIRYATSVISELTWSAAAQCTSVPIPKPPGISEFFQVTGLEPNTKYFFGIKVADETPRWSILSNIASNTTLPLSDSTLPGTITDLMASQATSISVQLTWTAPGEDANSGTVSGYDIRYHTSTITEVIWDITTQSPSYPTPVAPGEQQAYTISGLLSSQKYYFAVKAFDEEPNYSILSNIANATTLSSTDDIAPAAISDLSALATSENVINLTWTAPGDDANSGAATGYDIRYFTSSISEATWENATLCINEPIPQSSGSQESFSVSGLFAGTTYYFAIKTYDERPNYSEISNIASATTMVSTDSTPPAKIDDLAVVETSESTATLTWTAPGDDDNSGIATVYDLHYSTSTINQGNWELSLSVSEVPSPKPAGSTETFQVTGLNPDTTYYFAIKTGDEIPNWSPISNTASGKTSGESLPTLNVTMVLEKTVIKSEEKTNLVITVLSESNKQPVEQARVELIADNAELIITPKISLTGPDGRLTVILTAPIVSVNTEITISAEISKTGFAKMQRFDKLTVEPVSTDLPKFNLQITQEHITLSKSEVKAGENVSVYANITNLGPDDADGFSVRFYLDGSQFGIDYPVVGLDANSYILIEVPWKAIEGNHFIKVEIIPDTPEHETDDSDNIAESNFIINPSDTDEPEDDEDDSKEQGLGSSIWIAVILIIVIIVIILVFLVMRRKRKPESQYPDDARAQTPLQPPATEMAPELESQPTEAQEQPQYPETSGTVPDQEEVDWDIEQPTSETGEVLDIPQQTDDQVEFESAPEADLESQDPLPEQDQIEELEIIQETEPQPETLPEEQLEQEPETYNPELDQQEQPQPDSQPEIQPETQPEQPPQLIPCPNCQNLINLNIPSCPHCNIELI